MRRPFSLWLLVFLLLFLALGGFYGGLAMLLDPSGASLQMTDVLPRLPIRDYVLPGLFLVTLMGALPLLLIGVLLARPAWPILDRLFAWSGHHWAWTGTIVLGAVLLAWLGIQAALIGFRWPVQYVTAVNGLLILLTAFLPGVRGGYRLAP